MTALEYKLKLDAEKRRLNQENNVITDLSQIAGWNIVELARWKPGVVKYTAQRQSGTLHEQIIGYAKDQVFESLQLPV